MSRSLRYLWLLIIIIISVAATVLLLGHMVTSPGTNVVSLWADTGKNYFTFIFHAVYDHGIWFTGMNYPYGEHVIYADGQPVISTFLNTICKLSVSQALAVMNLLIGLGFVLAIVFTYKLLTHFGVHRLFAVVFACLIILISPQVPRLQNHFALAYPCIIPMLFYLSVQYYERRKVLWLILIFLLGYFVSFIHLYSGAVFFLWLTFYAIHDLLFLKGTFLSRFRTALPVIFTLITLFVVIKLTIYFTDPITDRPTYPWGFTSYVTKIFEPFISRLSPFWQVVLSLKVFRKLPELTEGYSYLGIVTTAILFIYLWYVIKKRKENRLIRPEKFSNKWIFIAICSLVFAMGIPFVWGLDGLLNYLSVFKQFRSVGRFSWIFYYIVSIYSVVILYTWYVRYLENKRKIFANTILVICLLAWSVEASGYINYTHQIMENAQSNGEKLVAGKGQNWSAFLQQQKYKSSDFQGLILLPYFAVGSEKLWIGEYDVGAFQDGIVASLQLDLPIVNIMMSRTSWSETEKQVANIAGPYVSKPMLADLKSSKPFLVLKYQQSTLDPDQLYLLECSKGIGDFGNCTVFICYPDSILQNDKRHTDAVEDIAKSFKGEDTCVGSTGTWYIDHMDSSSSTPYIFGSGGRSASIKKSAITDTITMKPGSIDLQYELSCWFLVNSVDFSTPNVNLKFLDANMNFIEKTDMLTKRSVDTHGLWFRASLYFKPPAACRYIAFDLDNPNGNSFTAMDELMLRPADAIIISKDKSGRIMANNHLLSTH